VNSVNIIGNLTRDPELRSTTSGKSVATLRLAVDATVGTTFVDVDVWEKTAEACCEYLAKGRKVAVSGELRYREWTTQDGQKRSTHSISAVRVEFLSSPQKADEPAAVQSDQPATTEYRDLGTTLAADAQAGYESGAADDTPF
jgi:single-strand DNA-binding protein